MRRRGLTLSALQPIAVEIGLDTDKGLSAADRIVIGRLQSAIPGAKVKPVTGCQRGAAMMAKFFIDRPVLANVIALLTIIVGLVALLRLPVSQYPKAAAAHGNFFAASLELACLNIPRLQ
jgi:hypothetical protein